MILSNVSRIILGLCPSRKSIVEKVTCNKQGKETGVWISIQEYPPKKLWVQDRLRKIRGPCKHSSKYISRKLLQRFLWVLSNNLSRSLKSYCWISFVIVFELFLMNCQRTHYSPWVVDHSDYISELYESQSTCVMEPFFRRDCWRHLVSWHKPHRFIGKGFWD